ncbi:MAG: class I tRNA ligase family protein [Candidatus Paceibacteria bacterium]
MEKETKSETAAREEEILAFWSERCIFEKSLAKPAPNGEFVFYEGPPTANNHPAIHHLESRAFKDLIPRYKTMRGYHVRRKAGWDTHGLPVELEVEKELGLKNKKDIERYGVAAFNRKCRESVQRYIDEWKEFTDRAGYWVDHAGTYFTFANSYMESVWSIIKHVHERGLLYKDYKVVPWCPRCGTALSSHEVADGYRNVTDDSVYARFTVKNPEKHGLPGGAALVAWTTTPWTLPGNVALAVGRDIEYVLDADGNVVAKNLLEHVKGANHEVAKTFKGADLVGIEYEPLFPYLVDSLPKEEKEKLPKAYRVYEADFVSTEEGTGIVHTAVMYGTDDFELGTALGLPKHHLVTLEGRFSDDVTEFAGRLVTEANRDIITSLEEKGALLSEQKVEHTYPFCWRCKEPLIYYATDSWYVRMSTLRDELVRENEKINWEPAHIKEGRFGEWLREVKDWAVSRSRYWGTPLPVWMNEETGETVVIGSLDELKKRTKKSGNTYLLMRHAEAESNRNHFIASEPDEGNPLTGAGLEQARRAAEGLKKNGIDLIITSPFLRTRETAEIAAGVLGYPKEDIVVDERIREFDFGNLNHWPIKELRNYWNGYEDMFVRAAKGGETLADMRQRVGEFIYALEEQHTGKKILVVAHEYTMWLLEAVAQGLSRDEIVALKRGVQGDFYANAEVHKLDFVPLPHNEDYELDFHKPFIDEVALVGDGGEALARVPEVLDAWFDSGSMPFAQDHYPFESREWVEGPGYPADFISEAIDQTRGWFYTLHAIGTLMGRGHAYKNVISLGHLLDAKGKKMSKSVGNVIDPWDLIPKYGVDALRYWMYTINEPGASKNFDERTVDEIVKKNFTRLINVYTLYALYEKDTEHTDSADSTHVLDQWIVAQMREVHGVVTDALDAYQVDKAARPLADFVDDLSTWYVRRSRERLKGTDEEDKKAALKTMRWVLRKYAKLAAPFTPFIAEWLWQKVRRAADEESVHLAAWCTVRDFDEKVLKDMAITRDIVSSAFELRAAAGIKVRQPLKKLTVNNEQLAGKPELQELIKDEVNVKEIDFGDELVLDTDITPALAEEGEVRELVRFIQDLRKKAGLAPRDKAVLVFAGDTALLEKHWEEIRDVANLTSFEKGAEYGVSEA